ncbi:Alpha/Beta hydrolase protein [Penicillium brevicompactum]|uniref:Alpha/Beta hydrolase protein n=1 Tax=Penicillium brevicompactum TaxID=5074 RepID=UPI00253FBEC0|nr:Alpha/Beta hydrolase protein [Penicillium brevicompactum]KAJ5337417.1 Alpha/Beta hydrolase protein [Penicillium brevicompactum]
MATASIERSWDIQIPSTSGGSMCGWLYTSEYFVASKPGPAIVVAHGLGDLEALDTGSSSSAPGGIILGSSDQWRTWYSTIKVTTKSLGVWKYLDPDASNPEKIPQEPREIHPGDAQEGAQEIKDLTDDNYKVFQRLFAHQDRQTLQFRWKQRNLDRIGQQIRRTVAASHQHLVADIENPRTLLQSL